MRFLKAFLMALRTKFRSTFLETWRPAESEETPALLETGTVLEKHLPLVSFWLVEMSTKLLMPRSAAVVTGGLPTKMGFHEATVTDGSVKQKVLPEME